MRALLQALAELRAGNTSMRNFVVPLAKEAKQKRNEKIKFSSSKFMAQ